MSDNDYNIIPIPVAKNASVPTLSNNGKPTFVYIGAQGCPFCAQQRWAFAVALSRFGNFSSLFYDKSATDDGNVPTFMFNFSTAVYNEATSQLPVNNGPYGDSNPTPFFSGTLFSSQYINFEAFDQAGGSFLTNISGINALSPNIYTNVYEEGNAGINVPSGSSVPNESKGFGIKNFWIGGVPFFDINNQYVFDGATIDPVIFNSNGALLSQYSTHSDLLNSIENPTQNSFGETVLGAANILTAEICSTINNTAPVCKLSYISGLQNIINSAYA
jgi:hypothetical protein